MPNSDYYFFVDANQPSPSATDYINVQTSTGAYGPISPATAGMDVLVMKTSEIAPAMPNLASATSAEPTH